MMCLRGTKRLRGFFPVKRVELCSIGRVFGSQITYM